MFTHHKPRPGFVYVVRRDGDEFKIGSTYWATALGVPTDAFRETQQ